MRNLKYLNSRQALADYAYFIEYQNKQYNFGPSTKWVVFGSAYAGALAAWMRVKYPHLVYISVASGAPVLAKINFKGVY